MKNTGIINVNGLTNIVIGIVCKGKFEQVLGKNAYVKFSEVKVVQNVKKGKLSKPKLEILVDITGFKFKQGEYTIHMKRKLSKIKTSKKFFEWFFYTLMTALYQDLPRTSETQEHYKAFKDFIKKRFKFIKKNSDLLDKGMYYYI